MHDWKLLLENYPSYAYDWWQCTKCGMTDKFTTSEAPFETELVMCNLGHLHTQKKEAEWPETIG